MFMNAFENQFYRIAVFSQYYDKNPIQKFNRLEIKYKIKFMFKFEC